MLTLIKDGEEYRHIIKDIKPEGAAAKAGMKNKMILLAMNGRDCRTLGHKQVVQEVKSGGKNVIIRCKVVTDDEIAEKIAEKVSEVAPAAAVASTLPAQEPAQEVKPTIVRSKEQFTLNFINSDFQTLLFVILEMSTERILM